MQRLHAFEQYDFSNLQPSSYENKLQRFDEKRRFQMCFWEPALSPNICPEFEDLEE